ncbi:hypothetical protein V3C99_018607 [Haemonchus contortus]|uniref:Endo/exonuclease/phosphatase domain-containing protein n=1 Tax=Haemonchus contortus TaxID=6289 RepID=A0A7I4Z161_HAECO
MVASEACIEDLVMHAMKIKSNVIGLTETRGYYPLLHATFETEEELIDCHIEEELEAFCMDMEKLCREDHTFFKVIVGDFNAKICPRRTAEEPHIRTNGVEWNEQGERLSELS